MGDRTLLICDPSESWREWLKAHRGDRDFLRIDPGDPTFDYPGRISLHRKDKVFEWRFVGGLEPIYAPHQLVAGVVELLALARPELLVIGFPSSPSPLRNQLGSSLVRLIKPSEVLLGARSRLKDSEFAASVQRVELEDSFPRDIVLAQRRAQWMRLREESEPHEMQLDDVQIDGARLGIGQRIPTGKLSEEGLEAWHAEILGSTLFAVVEQEPSSSVVSRLLDTFHCQRAHFVDPGAYDGLICAFANQRGEDFGFGTIERIDWTNRVIHCMTTAVPPAPVRTLRVGGLRIDAQGRELGELRPWQV